jgi:DNA-binding response OmpR family regulator
VTRVLVVDDDVDINEALQEALRLSGYDAVGATTGAAALEETARLCPDLVLLDQMLPDIDGVEICRRLRSAPTTRWIPIVFVTARADEKARINGLALGADDYVVKPFSLAELLLRIRAVLRRARPVDLRLPPEWMRLRDQFRVWTSYADLHLARGEWRDCLELSRNTLNSCYEVLSASERAQLEERIALCLRNTEGTGPTP